MAGICKPVSIYADRSNEMQGIKIIQDPQYSSALFRKSKKFQMFRELVMLCRRSLEKEAEDLRAISIK